MINISKDGVELSHPRYVSDFSTGIFSYLNILVLSKYKIISLPFLISLPLKWDEVNIDTLFLIVLFFMTTSLGFFMSIISWFILEVFVNCFERIGFSWNFPLQLIGYSKRFKDIRTANNVTSFDSFQSTVIDIEHKINNTETKPNISRFLLQRSMRILLRNISLFILIDAVILLQKSYLQFILFFGIALILLAMAGFLGFFANAGLFTQFLAKEEKPAVAQQITMQII